jgi:diguanylate cyclase (GGDEF)-like protein/PAS domain S-box-containing protein
MDAFTDEVTEYLYQGSVIAYVAGGLLAALLVVLFWGMTPPAAVAAWVAVIEGAYLARIILVRRYRADSLQSSDIWLKRFRVGSAITGLIWGTGIFLLFKPNDIVNQSLLAIIVAGLIAGSSIAYSIDRLSLVGIVVPTILSLTGLLVLEGYHQSTVLVVIVLTFLAYVLMIARRSGISIQEYLRLRIEAKSQNEFLGSILENEPHCVKVIGTDGDLKQMNRAGLEMLEVDSLSEAKQFGLINFVLPKHRRAFAKLMRDVMNGDQGSLTFEIRGRKGTSRWLETHASPLHNDKGQVTALLGVTQDITERVASDVALNLAANVFKHAGEGIVITDDQGTILDVNQSIINITGYERNELIGQNPNLFKSGRQSKEFYQMMWQLLSQQGYWTGELWNRRKNGDVYPELLTITAVKNDDGKLINYIGMFTDIVAIKEQEHRLMQLAYYDELTGLPNRRLFQDRLRLEIERADVTHCPLGLLLLDLDHFKEVNDTLGHDRGDLLLKDAAKRIAMCLRDTDTVARLGGDEFTILVPDCDSDHLQQIAWKINDQLKVPFLLGANEKAYVSASIGIAVYPNDARDVRTLMKHADQAMYAAKNAGRDQSSFFVSSMQMEAQERLVLTNDLRLALSRHELRVHYQPIVNMKTGKIEKAEALLRWFHPARGSISPAIFIPLAEEFGLIHDIGNWVLLQVLSQLTEWQRRENCTIQISVNRSPKEFERDSAAWIDLITAPGLDGRCIAIEMTESLLLNESDYVKQTLDQIRMHGVELSLDDFGTGYSALSYLTRFKIDYLKIDRSFVTDITDNESDRALIDAIIVMAHKLGIRTIAEGVESEAQRELLAALGCDFAQGYFYSKPVPAEEFENMVLQEPVGGATHA